MATKGHPTTAYLEISTLHYIPGMKMKASRVPTYHSRSQNIKVKSIPSDCLSMEYKQNNYWLKRHFKHGTMQNREDSVCKFQSLLRKTLRIHILGNRNALCKRNLPTCFSIFDIVKLTFKQMSFLPLYWVVLQQTSFLFSKSPHEWAERTGSHCGDHRPPLI